MDAKIRAALALLVTLGFFGTLGVVIYKDIEMVSSVTVLLGSLGTMWALVMQHYFRHTDPAPKGE